MAAACIFCGESKLTKEHLFPAWLIDRLPEEERTTKIPHEMFKGRESISKFSGLPFQQSVKVVCADCNNGWMSDIESGVQVVLDPILQGETGQVIDTDDQWRLAEWVYLRCLIFVATQNKSDHHMKDRCESFYASRQPGPTIFREGAAQGPSLSGLMSAYMVPFHGDLTGHVSLFVFYDERSRDEILLFTLALPNIALQIVEDLTVKLRRDGISGRTYGPPLVWERPGFAKVIEHKIWTFSLPFSWEPVDGLSDTGLLVYGGHDRFTGKLVEKK